MRLHNYERTARLARLSLLWIPFALIGLSALLGCARVALDESLLTGTPCAPPCWQNLIPGESGEDDVRRELTDSSFLKKGGLNRYDTEERGVALAVYSWQGRKSPRNNRILLQNGTILRIEIRSDNRMTLGDIVSRFGPPEGVYAFSVARETITLDLTLDYPAKGLSVVSYSPRVDPRKAFGMAGGILADDLAVTCVYYYAPTSLEFAFREVFLLRSDRIERMFDDEQAWQGFGQEVPFAEYDRP